MASVKLPSGLRAAGSPTPFYFYDEEALGRAAVRWKRAARSGVKVFYPYKCNRHPALLDRLAREGFGAEINIAADMPEAAARGIAGARLVVQGPAKAASFIDRALGVGATLVADGPEDTAAIFGRARALGRTPRYLLRLRAEGARAGQRAFGMDAGEVARIVDLARRSSQPRPAGLAFHLGTGLPGIAPYRRTILAAARIAALLREAGSPVEILDVGGGFSSAAESRYDDRGRPHRVRWTEPERIVRDLTSEVRRRIGEPEIWIEPGRALVAEAFLLVSRVIRVRAQREIFVDASRMAHGFFIARGSHPVAAIPPRRGRRSLVSIAGPLGTDLDVFVRRARMVPPREGDLLVFGAVGAYNLIAANGWAGPVPPVIAG